MTGLDVVLVARPLCREAGVHGVIADLLELYKGAGLIEPEMRPGAESSFT
jgi:hypothetical protein